MLQPSSSTRTETLNPAEFALVAHVRGWCHDSTDCVLCTTQTRAWQASRDADAQIMRHRTHARTEELRRIDAEITNAYLARELTEARDTSHFWMEHAADVERRLDTIISG